jgi:hypothetical protein
MDRCDIAMAHGGQRGKTEINQGGSERAMLYGELVRVERLWRMKYDEIIRKGPDQSEEQIDGDRSLDPMQRDRSFLQHLQKNETGQ